MILPLHATPIMGVRRGAIALAILLSLYYLYINKLPSISSISIPSPHTSPKSDTKTTIDTPSDLPESVPSSTTSAPHVAHTAWAISPLPSKHWQTWRVGLLNFTAPQQHWYASWRWLNPSVRYELLTDETIPSFINTTFSSPTNAHLATTYNTISDSIARADLLRYLILYAEGGVYSDLDTVALKPISQWVPNREAGKVNVIIGLEIDEPKIMWADWADNFAFCQSTLASVAHHRIFDIVIANIISDFDSLAVSQKVSSISDVILTFQDVLRTTGPVAFTKAVFEYLSEETGTTVSRANFSGINVAKRMADVLVLPTVGFVPGQPHSNSGKKEDAGAMVQHVGMGSWRGSHVFDGDRGKTPEQVEAEHKKKEEAEKKKKEDEERKKKEGGGDKKADG